MWTDEYISKQLLETHLNPDIDLASRKKTTIQKTIQWILEEHSGKGKLNILDLGCGPGLYTEIFAQHGHSVTGIDISKESINHAKKSAKKKGLDIHYINASYLDVELASSQYDLVVLIYTDLGVLIPGDRDRLLNLIYKTLKKGGNFVFDVLKDNDLELKVTPKNWEAPDAGFWKGTPYLALSESFLYEEESVILYQHLVVDSDDNIETYRFWTHFFSKEKIVDMLEPYHFSNVRFRDDIIPASDMWSGDNVLFTVTQK